MRRIGEPGVYEETVDVLYPGEQAIAEIRFDPETGEQQTTWYVSKAPGLRCALLRLRFRLFGAYGSADLRLTEVAVRAEREP